MISRGFTNQAPPLRRSKNWRNLRRCGTMTIYRLPKFGGEIGIRSFLAEGRREHHELQAELTSLKARRSSIDDGQIKMREALCQALNLVEAEIPFACELIQVRDEDKDWEGAAERLLRNFGLWLRVSDLLLVSRCVAVFWLSRR